MTIKFEIPDVSMIDSGLREKPVQPHSALRLIGRTIDSQIKRLRKNSRQATLSSI
jgi:hypothetical protein